MWAGQVIEGTGQYGPSQWGQASSEEDQAEGGGEAGPGGRGEGEDHHHTGDVAAKGETEDGREYSLPHQVWQEVTADDWDRVEDHGRDC